MVETVDMDWISKATECGRADHQIARELERQHVDVGVGAEIVDVHHPEKSGSPEDASAAVAGYPSGFLRIREPMPLPCVEMETGPQPQHAVIWLHGLGADGNDFAPIVPELVAQDWPPLRFVFPHAPMRPVTINGGMQMRAWYDIKGADIADKQDEDGIRASMAEVGELIARENERGVPSQHIILAGFSQGGAIALSAGLRYSEALAGIVALSTYLPLHEQLASERHQANHSTAIFWGHGREDPIVPIRLGALSRDTLQELGYAIDWHQYPMAHQVCMEELGDLRQWLGRRLGSTPR